MNRQQDQGMDTPGHTGVTHDTGAPFPRCIGRPTMERGVPLHGCIQIAGVHDLHEAAMLASLGVHAVGLPLRLPVNAEDLSEAEAATLVRGLPPAITPVGITYIDNAAEACKFCSSLNIRHIQLHGPIEALELARLRSLRPELYIIKSLVVHSREQGDNLRELEHLVHLLAPHVDAFITDTFNPATGASGATGLTHSWATSAALVRRSPRPVILAGGLHAGNVYDAIRTVRPAGVDAHTGVEGPDGRKSAAKVRAFVTEAQRGFTTLSSGMPVA